ncbi:MAG: flavodoxin [Bacillota bacterium]|nr:flavodoxin [Bacillota bacterium]
MKESVVVYFSKTESTGAIAKKISLGLQCDLCRIIPSYPYMIEDLNQEDPTCRSYVEAKDENSRPEILDLKFDIEKYDIIYLGFPIWFEDMPKVIYTFLESFDFTNKIIVPFATSELSNLKEITKTIQKLCPQSNVLAGMPLNGSPSCIDILEWIDQLPLE